MIRRVWSTIATCRPAYRTHRTARNNHNASHIRATKIIDPCILNPLRCFECQKFGHGSEACKGTEPVPGVVKLDTMVIAVTRQSALTAVAEIPPSVRNAQNGYSKTPGAEAELSHWCQMLSKTPFNSIEINSQVSSRNKENTQILYCTTPSEGFTSNKQGRKIANV